MPRGWVGPPCSERNTGPPCDSVIQVSLESNLSHYFQVTLRGRATKQWWFSCDFEGYPGTFPWVSGGKICHAPLSEKKTKLVSKDIRCGWPDHQELDERLREGGITTDRVLKFWWMVEGFFSFSGTNFDSNSCWFEEIWFITCNIGKYAIGLI